MARVIWCLFDDGNQSYRKALEQVVDSSDSILCFGFFDQDEPNPLNITFDLSSFNELFSKVNIYQAICNEIDRRGLDGSYKKPDIILASPPCESWSKANAGRNLTTGETCQGAWNTSIKAKQEGLFGDTDILLRKPFQILTHASLNESSNSSFQDPVKEYKSKFYTRVNGELCAFNTQEIIRLAQPKAWVIENPRYSLVWLYYRDIIGFSIPTFNETIYRAWDASFSKKPTIFASSHYLNLSRSDIPNDVSFDDLSKATELDLDNIYDLRSAIPDTLIKYIYNTLCSML